MIVFLKSTLLNLLVGMLSFITKFQVDNFLSCNLGNKKKVCIFLVKLLIGNTFITSPSSQQKSVEIETELIEEKK